MLLRQMRLRGNQYCSANALKEEAGESLELFFAKLRSGRNA